MMKGLDVLGCPTVISTVNDPSLRAPRLAQVLAWAAAGKIAPHVSHALPARRVHGGDAREVERRRDRRRDPHAVNSRAASASPAPPVAAHSASYSARASAPAAPRPIARISVFLRVCSDGTNSIARVS